MVFKGDRVPVAVITESNVGFTVIVKVTGMPLQPVPPVTKLPSDIGNAPTLTVAVTALVAVLIIETVLASSLATYTMLPSGLKDTPNGFEPTGIVNTT